MWSSIQRLQDGGEFIERHAQPAHAGVDLQMDGMRLQAMRGGVVQGLDMPRLPRGGSEPSPDDLTLFPAPEAGHQQNARLDARIPQWNCLIQRSDTQPLRSFRRQGARTFHSTMAIS